MMQISKRMLVPALLAAVCSQAVAADDLEAKREKMMKQGIDYLKSSQSDDGSWTTTKTVGITGLVLNGLLEAGVPESDPAVQKGLKNLKSFVQKDGGIYTPKSTHRNYETCISLMAFSNADKKKYADIIKNAEKFLRELQWDEGEGLETSDTAYGGAGYGGSSRPDLSNTQFLLEALKAAALPKTTRRSRRRSSSCPARKTWKPNTTPPPSPPRSTTAASITPRLRADRRKPAKRPTAD